MREFMGGMNMDASCLDKTDLLDYDKEVIQRLVKEEEWMRLELFDRIGMIYDFVRNDILFGYNENDLLPASKILIDGYGQCNTKAILLMALFRAVDIPCRLHGFTVDKKLQKGLIPGIMYNQAPDSIVHSWVEVAYEDKWIALEGVILDQRYLTNLQKKNAQIQGLFCGYGVADQNFQHPKVEWNGKDTYIQRECINHDFGVFKSPDAFFKKHPQPFSTIQQYAYEKFGRKMMNQTVAKIRALKYADMPEEEIKN